MAEEKGLESPRARKTPRQVRAVKWLLFAVVVVSSGWVIFQYLHDTHLLDQVRNAIESNLSILRVAVPIGLGTMAASLSVQKRRRSRRARTTPKSRPMTFGPNEKLHPLMMTQRPARDASFIIRKTRTRGRISRNREGERLPATDLD